MIPRILGKSATSDPGSAAAGYDAAPRVTVAAAGGGAAVTPLTVNCSNLGNDQFLASHIRNLRLLQATLARLASESGKSTPTG